MHAVFGDWNSETQLTHSLGGGCEEILERGCSKTTNSHFLFSGKILSNTTNNQQHHQQHQHHQQLPTTSNTRTEILSFFKRPILWGYGFSAGMCQCYRILWANSQGSSISWDVPCCKNMEKNWLNSYGEGDLLWYVCISNIYIYTYMYKYTKVAMYDI